MAFAVEEEAREKGGSARVRGKAPPLVVPFVVSWEWQTVDATLPLSKRMAAGKQCPGYWFDGRCDDVDALIPLTLRHDDLGLTRTLGKTKVRVPIRRLNPSTCVSAARPTLSTRGGSSCTRSRWTP